MLAALRDRGCRRFLIEGGGVTVSRFLDAGAVDRLHVAVAPLLIGSGRPAFTLAPIATLEQAIRPACRVFRLGDDVLFDSRPAVARYAGRASRSRWPTVRPNRPLSIVEAPPFRPGSHSVRIGEPAGDTSPNCSTAAASQPSTRARASSASPGPAGRGAADRKAEASGLDRRPPALSRPGCAHVVERRPSRPPGRPPPPPGAAVEVRRTAASQPVDERAPASSASPGPRSPRAGQQPGAVAGHAHRLRSRPSRRVSPAIGAQTSGRTEPLVPPLMRVDGRVVRAATSSGSSAGRGSSSAACHWMLPS